MTGNIIATLIDPNILFPLVEMLISTGLAGVSLQKPTVSMSKHEVAASFPTPRWTSQNPIHCEIGYASPLPGVYILNPQFLQDTDMRKPGFWYAWLMAWLGDRFLAAAQWCFTKAENWYYRE